MSLLESELYAHHSKDVPPGDNLQIEKLFSIYTIVKDDINQEDINRLKRRYASQLIFWSYMKFDDNSLTD